MKVSRERTYSEDEVNFQLSFLEISVVNRKVFFTSLFQRCIFKCIFLKCTFLNVLLKVIF